MMQFFMHHCDESGKKCENASFPTTMKVRPNDSEYSRCDGKILLKVGQFLIGMDSDLRS